MVTIKRLSGGSSAAAYFCRDYYAKKGFAKGQFYGLGAEELGLPPKVDYQTFERILQGYSPDGEKKLTRNAGHKDRPQGFDLCFSPPKSLGVLWGISNRRTQRKIEKALSQSVRETLKIAERICGQTRQGARGERLKEAKMVFALFTHPCSRTNDPQPHVHAIAANLAVNDDGTTSALESRKLFQAVKALGATFRADLASRVAELNLPLMDGEKFGFEVAVVPKRICDEFSTRRAEIEEHMAEEGTSGALAADLAARVTRGAKENIPLRELRVQWKQKAEAFGFNRKDLPEKAREVAQFLLPTPKLNPLLAVDGLLSQKAYLSEIDLIQKLSEQVQRGGYSAAKIQREAHKVIGELIEVGEEKGQRQFTTKETLAAEQALLERAFGRRKVQSHILPKLDVEIELASTKCTLSGEQKEAVRHLTRSAGGMKILSGIAGSGKTAVLDTTRKLYENMGYRVMGVSLAGVTAERLQQASGIPSKTIAAFIHDFKKPTAMEILEGIQHGKERIKIPGIALQGRSGAFLTRGSVVVVDEAGLVGTTQIRAFMGIINSVGAKVILVGDERQLPAIEAGSPFKALGDKIGKIELKNIQRQKEDWAKDVVRSFAEGDSQKALIQLYQHGRVSITDTVAEARSKLIKDWSKVDCKNSLILTTTKEEAGIFNRLAQEERRELGQTKRDHVYVNGVPIHLNDRVTFTKNSKLFSVSNGTMGTVEMVRSKGKQQSIGIRLDSHTKKRGKMAYIPLAQYSSIELAYAMTTHKSQGITVDNAFIYNSPGSQSREMAYTQFSRARNESRLYVTKECAGDELLSIAREMEGSDAKKMATDLQREREQKQQEHSKSHSNSHSL